jgi:hypothetical protein
VTKRLSHFVLTRVLIAITQTVVPVLLIRKQFCQVPRKNCTIDTSRKQALLALYISQALLSRGYIEPLLHDFEFVACIVKQYASVRKTDCDGFLVINVLNRKNFRRARDSCVFDVLFHLLCVVYADYILALSVQQDLVDLFEVEDFLDIAIVRNLIDNVSVLGIMSVHVGRLRCELLYLVLNQIRGQIFKFNLMR